MNYIFIEIKEGNNVKIKLDDLKVGMKIKLKCSICR